MIAAEDTRVTRKLLGRYEIHTPFTSFHQHTKASKTENLIERLERGDSIALVSDAGTPGVSDPGSQLIGQAIEKGISIIPVPGPSAALAALVASGMPTGRFAFDGFPPRARTDRREFFEALRIEKRTTVLFESPGRLVSTLEALFEALGSRDIAVARELTKKFEEIFRGTIQGAIEHFRTNTPRGEFTLVVGPSEIDDGKRASPNLSEIQVALEAAIAAGTSPRNAVESVSLSLKLPRNLVYRVLLGIRESGRSKGKPR